MIINIKKILAAPFTLPTAKEYAQRKLAEHERELIEARRIVHSAATNVLYHERVVADLRRALETME